jgi:FHA domain-containing protein
MPQLLVKSGGTFAQRLELKAGLSRLGRNPANDVRIDDPTVSGLHCEISVLDDTVIVRDCGSTNGTFINGRPIQEATLLAGQVLLLGAVELMIDATPVTISIPKLEVELPKVPTLLSDGSPACLNHPETRGSHRCTKCSKVFCEACVHVLRLVGGKALTLCPSCSGKCESISVKPPAKRKKKLVVGLLQKTLKLAFRRKE